MLSQISPRNVSLSALSTHAAGAFALRNVSTSATVESRSTWNHNKARTGRKYPHISPQDYSRDVYKRPGKSLYHNPEDWAEVAQYPDINPPEESRGGIRLAALREAAQTEKIPTVLDKMKYFHYMPMTMDVPIQQRYRHHLQKFWKPWLIPGFSTLYNILPFYQYLSRTAIVSDELPKDYYSFMDEAKLNDLVEKVRLPVIDALLTQRRYLNKNYDVIPLDEQELVNSAKNVVDATLRVVDVTCARDFPHLQELQVDTDARCEAYWRRSGFMKFKGDLPEKQFPDKRTRNFLTGEDIFQYVEDDFVHRLCRHENPLPEVLPRKNSLSLAAAVVLDQHECKEPQNPGDMEVCSPDTYGFDVVWEDRHRPSWIPGFWFGDLCEFSTLGIDVPTKWGELVRDLGEDAAYDNMAANLILGSFSRVLGQAMYLGFTPLNELTYPITTQSVLTNGRDWMFGTYQANTIALWQEDADNPYQNLCWLTKPLRLFERLDEDAVVGFNDEVLKNLLRFYLKAPVAPTVNLRPHLKFPLKTYWKRETSQVPFWTKNDNVDPRFNIYPKRVEI